MSDSGLKPIDDKFLDRTDIFALKFDEGYVFLQVEGWEQTQYEPYDQISTLATESDSGFTRLNDPNGNDVLHIPKSEKKVLHVGIGQTPAEVRRYTNYPEGENRLRTIPNLSVPRPSTGDDYGHVDGDDSPYENPTEAEELVIPPGIHLDFNFYNPNPNLSRTPILNIKIREYNVTVIDPRKNPNVTKRVLSPGSPMPIYPVGSIDTQSRYSDLAEKWGVPAMTEGEVKRQGGN